MKLRKKILASALSLLMLTSSAAAAPLTAQAATPAMSAGATYSSGGFSYDVVNGAAVIKGYTGSAADVVIPEKLGGYSVKTIGYDAFINNSSVTSVTIPDSVTAVEWRAFKGCARLQTVVIGGGVTEMRDEAFADCPVLTTVTVDSGTTVIGVSAFANCVKLSSLSLPNTVAVIEESAFTNTALPSLIVPSSVQTIEREAFKGCSAMKTVSFGTGLQTIGFSAFENCVNLTKVTIPNNVTTLESRAFQGCIRMTELKIGSGVTVMDSAAFANCSKLKTVTINNGTTLIGDSAFSSCTMLESVSIPNSVKSIGKKAFYQTALIAPVIPNSVEKIGDSAFEYCTRMQTLTLGSRVSDIGQFAFRGCSALTSLTLPDSVLKLRYSAFMDCTGLAELNIGNHVEIMEDSAFKNCTALKNVRIAKGTTQIGGSAFMGCTSLESVLIPDSVEIIKGYAFAQSGLPKIVIPDSVTSVGDYAFYECGSLSDLTIGSGVETIGDNAFCRCISLPAVRIPDSVTELGDDTFLGCKAMKTAFIGNSVEKMGVSAFSSCSALETVVIDEGTSVLGNSAFFDCSALTAVYIPYTVLYIGSSKFTDTNPYDSSVFFRHSSALTIYGERSSFAEKFADNNDIRFVEGRYVEPVSVLLNKSSLSLYVGDTYTLTATVYPSDAYNKTVTWSSTNTRVATVSNGKITAKAEGAATIIAKTVNGYTASCVVTVSARPVVLPTSVTLNKSSLSLTVGNAYTLTATVEPSNATDKSLTWSSTDTGVATVSNGKVTAKSVGSADIQVKTCNGKTAVCRVTVKERVIVPESVTLDKSYLTMTVSGTEALSATVLPQNATNKAVTWQSSNTAAATVSGGTVTAKSSGTAVITAKTSNGKTASCTVTVLPKPGSVTQSLGNTSAGLSVKWNAAANATSYIVYYRRADVSAWSSSATAATSFYVPGAQSGVMYCVQIQSVGYGGVRGSYSRVKSMTYLGCPAFTSLSYSGSNKLAWSKVGGANKYQIAKKKSGDSAYQYIVVTTNSYTDSNIVKNATYCYQVRAMYATAKNGTAYGAWSKTGTLAAVTALEKPNVSLSNKSNGIRVDWNKINGAKKYVVYFRKASVSTWSSIETTNNYYPYLNVQSGTLYCFQVRPIGAVNGPYSRVKSLTFIGQPQAELSIYQGGAFLWWDVVAGANRYQIAKKSTASSGYEYFVVYDNAFYDADISMRVGYYYQVRAMYATENNGTAYGAWSKTHQL